MMNMTTPWMDMAQRFFPTISQLSGSLKRFSPNKEGKKDEKGREKHEKYGSENKVNTQE